MRGRYQRWYVSGADVRRENVLQSTLICRPSAKSATSCPAVGPSTAVSRASDIHSHAAEPPSPPASSAPGPSSPVPEQSAINRHIYIGQSDITEAMIMIRSPFCGCNTI